MEMFFLNMLLKLRKFNKLDGNIEKHVNKQIMPLIGLMANITWFFGLYNHLEMCVHKWYKWL